MREERTPEEQKQIDDWLAKNKVDHLSARCKN